MSGRLKLNAIPAPVIGFLSGVVPPMRLIPAATPAVHIRPSVLGKLPGLGVVSCEQFSGG